MNDLDERYDECREVIRYLTMAVEEIRYDKDIENLLLDVAGTLMDKKIELEGLIEQRDAEEWEGEYRNRQREYRKMQGF